MPKKFSDATHGVKLISMLLLLIDRGSEGYTTTELIRLLQCSKQTVARLADDLTQIPGFSLTTQKRSRHVVYCLQADDSKIQHLEALEMAQMVACRHLMLSMLPRQVTSLLGKTPAAPGRHPGTPAKDISLLRTKGSVDYTEFQAQFQSLSNGILKKRVCKVTYRRGPPMPKLANDREFLFAPTRVIAFQNCLYFKGWEVEINAEHEVTPRYGNSILLMLQRCREVVLTRTGYGTLPQPENDAAENLDQPFGFISSVPEPYEVELEFSARAAGYVYDRNWSSQQSKIVQSDGRLKLKMLVQSTPEILSWILSFGPEVTVISPPWLREQVAENAARVCALYRPSEKDPAKDNPGS